MKKTLRAQALARRDAISKDDHEQWSFGICEVLVKLFYSQNLTGKKIALYNAIRSEADITPVLHALDTEGGCVALPVVDSSRQGLGFYRFHSQLDLEEGAFGVLEPEKIEEVVPQIIIVPLVAFDKTGHRLGYGKGYYDATLNAQRAANPSMLAIGVGFALQEVESIPVGELDAKLDAIITESGLITF